MNNQNFQEGFVKECMARGLNLEQTERLCKVANYASAFNNKDFSDAYDNRVVDQASSKSLPLSTKAALVKSAVDRMYNT